MTAGTARTAGAAIGLMLGAFVGLAQFGDQLLVPLLPAVGLALLGALVAPLVAGAAATRAPRRGSGDPARLELRLAAHRAMAELD